MKEQDIQRQILDWLKLKRIFHWRNNTGALRSTYKGKNRFMRFGAVGSPDIFAVIRGMVFGIEVKRPSGKLSEEQDTWRNEFMHAGGYYLIAHRLEDVTYWIGGLAERAKSEIAEAACQADYPTPVGLPPK